MALDAHSRFFDPTEEWDRDWWVERFRDELLPMLRAHGQLIGERAMQGDKMAEAIILRYHVFCEWLDPVNYRKLGEQLTAWIKEHVH